MSSARAISVSDLSHILYLSLKRASHRTRLTLRYGYGNDNYTMTADDYVVKVTASVSTKNERKYNRRLG